MLLILFQAIYCPRDSYLRNKEIKHNPVEPQLRGHTLFLRPPTAADASVIYSWLEDPTTVKFLDADDPIVVDVADLQRCFQTIQSRLNAARTTLVERGDDHLSDQVDLLFSIIQSATNQLVGIIVLQVSIQHQAGTVRTVVAPYCRGQGVGRQAKQALLHYGFSHLKLRKIRSLVLEDNVASIAVNKACGFKIETDRNGHIEMRGQHHPFLYMTITKSEYEHSQITCP